MKLSKATLILTYAASIAKRSSQQSSALFSSYRTSEMGFNPMKFSNGIPQNHVGFQTIQVFSKEIANSEKKKENMMSLSNDPRDFEVYYFHDEPKMKKRRSSRRKERKNAGQKDEMKE